VDFTFANHKRCFSETSALDYCGPTSYAPVPDRLLRNRGDGTFDDVTASAQIARAYGAGLGLVCTDFDGDGWTDVYVANDDHPNQLWINQRDGTFRDAALLAGCALNLDGETESSMGIDAGDFDRDGDADLFMTHLTDETNTLYRNDGKAMFEDYTVQAGLAPGSRRYTGFGTAWLDFDNDGWLDVLVANGAVKTIEALARAGDPYPLHQRNQLFRNRGDGSFEEISDRAGEAFRVSEVSRGAAFGDIDNDGDTDVLLMNNSGRARLLVNELGAGRSWLGLRMTDAEARFDLLGTRVDVIREDGERLRRTVRPAASYCSSNDPRILVGLGSASTVRAVQARWPDGRVEQWTDIPINRYTTLRRGTGHLVSE
jgi:hypothetical protein